MIRALQRRAPAILFLLVAIGSLAALITNHRRIKNTLEITVAAVDNLTQARLHVAQALLTAERVQAGDPTLPTSRPLAELEEALALLDDFLEGRRSLLGMGESGPLDPQLREPVANYARELRMLYRDLASGAYVAGDPVERQVRMAALAEAELSVETATYNALRQRLDHEEMRYRIRVAAWILFIGVAGGAFTAVRRASGRYEEALHSAEARYAALATHAEAGLVRTDEEGRVVESTPQWQELFGGHPGDRLGGAWWEDVSGEERARVAQSWVAQSVRVENFLLEVRQRALHGDARYLASRWVKIAGGMDDAPSWVGTFIDETEQRSLQNQLRQAQKMEAVGRLAGGIAHDFNNLLTVIKGRTEFALCDLGNAGSAEQDLAEVLTAAERAQNLTRHLLAFSRNQVVERRVLEVTDLVSSAEKMIRRLIGEHVDLAIMFRGEVGRVRMDPTQAEQVLINLAINARDAMPQGGQLTIEAEDVSLEEDLPVKLAAPFTPGRYVRVRVTDTGCGMDAETQEKIFEPFFTTKAAHQGTGLGLSTVFGIVAQSEGYIRVESEPGAGSTFEIYLPQTDEQPDDRASEHDSARKVAGSETILIVEDEQSVRAVARRILDRVGYLVLEAENGHDALAIWEDRAADIDVVLTDMVMPTMGGRELAGRLWDHRPTLPILFMSGYAEDEVMTQGSADSRVHFLEKPFDAQTLQQKVRTALDCVE